MPPADARMIAKLATCTWTFTHNRYMDITLYKLLWLLKEMRCALNVELHVAKSKALLPLVKDKLKNSMQIPWSFHFYPYRASEASANTCCRLCLMGCQV